MKKSLNSQINEYNKKHGKKKTVKEIVFDELCGMGYDVKTWDDVREYEHSADSEAVNYVTGLPYSGVNKLLLPDGAYLTWNQIQNMGGHVKRGAASYLAVFCKPVGKENEEVNDKEARQALRYYRIFNSADVEGIPPYNYEHNPEYTYEEIFFDDIA